jgi:hypothetical protein
VLAAGKLKIPGLLIHFGQGNGLFLTPNAANQEGKTHNRGGRQLLSDDESGARDRRERLSELDQAVAEQDRVDEQLWR